MRIGEGQRGTRALQQGFRDEKAKAHADGIIEAVSANYDFGHGNIAIGASIGIALVPEHGHTAENLLSRRPGGDAGDALVFRGEDKVRRAWTCWRSRS